MQPDEGCVFCGRPRRVGRASRAVACALCGATFESREICEADHAVCERCRAVPAEDYIAAVCAATTERDPAALARRLMLHPAVKLHGPEHHFLVPAVLLAAHANATGERESLPTRLREARRRSQGLTGCLGGTHGDCVAAVGAGVFVSALTGATPLSRVEWRRSNLATARALVRVAEAGGPRCCKRCAFLALIETADFVAETFGVRLPIAQPVVCTHFERNAECLRLDCQFFPRPSRARPPASGRSGPAAPGRPKDRRPGGRTAPAKKAAARPSSARKR